MGSPPQPPPPNVSHEKNSSENQDDTGEQKDGKGLMKKLFVVFTNLQARLGLVFCENFTVIP